MKRITKIYKNILFKFRKKIDLDKEDIDYRSLDQLFNYFGTDKGTEVLNPYASNSNELLGHGFGIFYEKEFSKFKNDLMNILEIGTWEGASTAAFNIFFSKSNVYGLDKTFRFKYKSKRINFNFCDVNNIYDLKKFSSKFDKKFFKIIIDDGSHILTEMISSLKFFFKYVEKGGFFIIEDFNAPVYFEELNDSFDNEILMKDIFENIMKKKKFKSKILSNTDQKFLFDNISKIKIYKGKTSRSDIAFIRKVS